MIITNGRQTLFPMSIMTRCIEIDSLLKSIDKECEICDNFNKSTNK